MPEKQSPYPDNAYLDPRLEADLIKRISRAEGHLRSIKRMLSNHEDCTQIATQLAAVQAAVRQVTLKLLDEHVESCVGACMEAGPEDRRTAMVSLKRMITMLLK